MEVDAEEEKQGGAWLVAGAVFKPSGRGEFWREVVSRAPDTTAFSGDTQPNMRASTAADAGHEAGAAMPSFSRGGSLNPPSGRCHAYPASFLEFLVPPERVCVSVLERKRDRQRNRKIDREADRDKRGGAVDTERQRQTDREGGR